MVEKRRQEINTSPMCVHLTFDYIVIAHIRYAGFLNDTVCCHRCARFTSLLILHIVNIKYVAFIDSCGS